MIGGKDMKQKRLIICISFIACLSLNVFAQRSMITQQRFALDEALTTLEEYVAYATISDGEVYYSFIDLFTSPNAPVYNDLLGFSTADTMSVSTYAQRLQSGLKNKMVQIQNVNKEDVSYAEDGKWIVKLSFDKVISYLDRDGIYLASDEFYDGKSYRLTATIIYDDSNNSCKIESITGEIASKRERLGDQYFAFKNKDPRDKQLTYQGRSLTFNRYNQALLPGSVADVDKKSFFYPDASIDLRPVVDNRIISMNYKIRRLRLKPHFDIGLNKAYSFKGGEQLTENKAASNAFGIDFGYSFYNHKVFSLGVFTGVGATMSRFNLGIGPMNYAYNTNADVDGDTYTRHYDNLSLSQTYKLTDLNVPVYMDMNFQLHKIVALYIDLGVKLNFNIGSKITETTGSAYIYGEYTQPEYGNLRLDEHWGFNGFGQTAFSEKDLLHPELQNVSGFTADLLGGFGFRITIPQTPLALDASLNYVMGLTDAVKVTSPQANLSNNITNPIVYNTISGLNSTEHVRNISEGLTAIKRQSLRLNIGILFKF